MSHQHQPAEAEIDPGGMRIRQRLRALRGRYPGLALTTELTHIHDDQVVIRATISFPDGTAVSAYAAEPTDSTGLLDGALELAEQRATARALDMLGVGDVPDGPRREARPDEAAPTRTPSPVATVEPAPERPPIVRPDERNTPPVVEALRRGQPSRGRSDAPAETPAPVLTAPPPATERPPRTIITAPVDERLDRPVVQDEPEAETPEPQPATSQPEPAPPHRPTRSEPVVSATTDEDAEELDMADYSWTHFWTWAREYELKTKGQVEQKIGRTIDGLAPQEVRLLLNEAGVPL